MKKKTTTSNGTDMANKLFGPRSGLHCVQFDLHLTDPLLFHCKIKVLRFYDIYGYYSRWPNFYKFYGNLFCLAAVEVLSVVRIEYT